MLGREGDDECGPTNQQQFAAAYPISQRPLCDQEPGEHEAGDLANQQLLGAVGANVRRAGQAPRASLN